MKLGVCSLQAAGLTPWKGRFTLPISRAMRCTKRLGRPKISHVLEKVIQSHLRVGKGMLAVARECGVGESPGNLKHQPPGRVSRVDGLLVKVQIDATSL